MIMQSTLFFDELNAIAEKYPNNIALLNANDQEITYQQLMDYVERAHGWLYSIGLRPGDALITLLPNAIETVILFLASIRAGLVYAPLTWASTFPEIIRWKKKVNAKVSLVANTIHHLLQMQINELDWRVEIININNQFNWPLCEHIAVEKTGTIVMQSSGSTGEAKALLLSADRLWTSAKAFSHYHQIEESVTRFWNYLPMSYLGGLLNSLLIPFAAQGSVFIDDTFNGKTFLNFWSTIERYQINSIWLVPSILRGLLNLSNRIGLNRTYPKIQHCFLGTAPILLEEKQNFFKVFGIQPLESYGFSEAVLISSESMSNVVLRSQFSVGSILPNIEVQLRPMQDSEEHETFEIWVKTPHFMLGYLTENGISEPPFDEHGFMPSGDFGQMVNGQLLITGRRRDIIKKGGALILLREIEQIVSSYPNVVEVAAVKIDHSFYGESFNLYVCPAASVHDYNVFQTELSQWLHKQLAKDKWPEKIFMCRDFPKTPSGKIQKHLLETRNSVNA